MEERRTPLCGRTTSDGHVARAVVCAHIRVLPKEQREVFDVGFPAVCSVLSSSSRDTPAPELKESGQPNSQRPGSHLALTPDGES